MRARARVRAQARARAAARWAVWPDKWPASQQTADCRHCHSQQGSRPCRCTCTCRRCPGTVCRRLRGLAAGGGCWSQPGGWWPTAGRTPHFGGCPARRLRAEDAGGQSGEKSGHCFAIMPTALVGHASPAVLTPCAALLCPSSLHCLLSPPTAADGPSSSTMVGAAPEAACTPGIGQHACADRS